MLYRTKQKSRLTLLDVFGRCIAVREFRWDICCKPFMIDNCYCFTLMCNERWAIVTGLRSRLSVVVPEFVIQVA